MYQTVPALTCPMQPVYLYSGRSSTTVNGQKRFRATCTPAPPPSVAVSPPIRRAQSSTLSALRQEAPPTAGACGAVLGRRAAAIFIPPSTATALLRTFLLAYTESSPRTDRPPRSRVCD